MASLLSEVSSSLTAEEEDSSDLTEESELSKLSSSQNQGFILLQRLQQLKVMVMLKSSGFLTRMVL